MDQRLSSSNDLRTDDPQAKPYNIPQPISHFCSSPIINRIFSPRIIFQLGPPTGAGNLVVFSSQMPDASEVPCGKPNNIINSWQLAGGRCILICIYVIYKFIMYIGCSPFPQSQWYSILACSTYQLVGQMMIHFEALWTQKRNCLVLE